MASHKNQQIIDFDESEDSWPIYIHCQDVKVIPSSYTRDVDAKASTKITTQNVVDYSWEDRYTLGHLISFHSHTKLVAYVLSISNKFMIRVLNEENSSRCLIKEFTGDISDIEFSKSKVPYIASIDVNGSVKINKVIVNMEVLECQIVLHIKANPLESLTQHKISYSRVMWCGHNDIDDVATQQLTDTGTNISLLLGIVHGTTFEVLQVDTVESELSGIGLQQEGKLDRAALRLIASSFQEQYADSENLTDLFLPYLCYTSNDDSVWITSLAISSDAAAFAVALHDGSVHFFTLDGSVSSGLKEAYSWRPFDGDAVWSLLFLDDCRPGRSTDSFWCHVVVGGAFNRQLKLFRCDKWDCVQTVTFQSPMIPCLMTAHIDLSARFLIMSDIRLKVLYLLEIDCPDNAGQIKLFKSVQEFVLPQPLLSFDINSITCTQSSDGAVQVALKMFTITKSAFQKMRVVYLTKGDRMSEVLLAEKEDQQQQQQPGDSLVSHHHTHLPSTTNSFQDPAIISSTCSTTAHNEPPYHSINISSITTPTATSSIDLHPHLQHLFATVSLPHNNEVHLHQCHHDSGDDSGDEASIDAMQRDLGQICVDGGKIYVNEEEEEEEDQGRGFPLPPYTSNGKWNNEYTRNKVERVTLGNEELVSDGSKNNGGVNEELLSRLLAMMEAQKRESEILSRSVKELRETSVKCTCRDARQLWSDRASKEVSEGCQKVIAAQLGGCVRDAVDTALPRITSDMGARVGEDVRARLATVEPLIRDFTNNLLHDKKFITFMGGTLADAMEKNLRAVYVDMVRKELVPALGRTMDKLFADTRLLFKDGVRDVLASVGEANKSTAKALEGRLASESGAQSAAEMDAATRKMMADMSVGRAAMLDAINGQVGQMARMNETVQWIKDTLMVDGHVMLNEVSGRQVSRVNSVMNMAGESGEQRVQRLLAANNYVAAMDEALSLTNLSVVISVCTRVPSKSVLSGTTSRGSSLAGNSILALIQQLSRDFNDHLDLKIGYLFDAMLSLDTNEPAIRDHVSKVLKGVSRRLQLYLDQQHTSTSQANRDKVALLLRLVTSRIDSP